MTKLYTGIDIGSHNIKVVIAHPSADDNQLHIASVGTAPTTGMRHGYITDSIEVTRAIKDAITRASQSGKFAITSARVAISGIGLDEMRVQGDISLTASGSIITARDLERVVRDCENRIRSRLINKSVIHTIPLEYKIDNVRIQGSPIGLQGAKLSCDAILITMLTQHHDMIIEAIERAGIEVEGIMAGPLAASLVTLSKTQKNAGVLLANIGSDTTSIIVFENDNPISIKVFPNGSLNITHAIALAFRIPPIEAEQLKRGAVSGSDIPQKKLQLIIAAELKNIFKSVNSHLKNISREGLLPAGIVLTGGGANIGGIIDVAKQILKVPSSVAQICTLPRSAPYDQSWAVAFGLCRWAYAEDENASLNSLRDVFGKWIESIRNGIKGLLP